MAKTNAHQKVTKALERAIKAVGGQGVLADRIGVSPSQLSHWMAGVRPVPAARAVAVERATDGAVSRKDLRPNDWAELWPELKAA